MSNLHHMQINTKISSIPSSHYANSIQSSQLHHNNQGHMAATHTSHLSHAGHNGNINTHTHTHTNMAQSGQGAIGYKKYQHRRIHTEADEIGTSSKYQQYQYQPISSGYRKQITKGRLEQSATNNNVPQTAHQAPTMHTGTGVTGTTVGSNKKLTPTLSGNTNAGYKPYKLASTKTNTNLGSGYGVQKYLKTQPDLDDSSNNSNFYNYQQNGDKGKSNLQQPSYLNTQYSGLGNIQVPPSKNKDLLNGKYQIEGVAGKGTFGVVYYGRNIQTGKKVALKKVLQDKKYKNRQLQILKQVHHQNILQMKDYFLTSQSSQQYLNVIMDFYSDNMYQIIKKKEINKFLIKLYTYQILRGLNYLNILSIAHRDIKPQNILVDRNTHKVVICDFGSAKKLQKGEPNIAYICSRCYRAPELIFGATEYTTQIDMWSLGCVIVQMVNGEAPFLGDSQIDQLLEIIKILGTPQKQDIQQMNPKYDLREYKKFPNIKPVPWSKLLKTDDALLIDLISKILEYSPKRRISAAEALKHPYFDELKQLVDSHQQKDMQYLKKMKVKTLPQLYDFTQCTYPHLQAEQLVSLGQVGRDKTVGQKHKDTEKLTKNMDIDARDIEYKEKDEKEKRKEDHKEKPLQEQITIRQQEIKIEKTSEKLSLTSGSKLGHINKKNLGSGQGQSAQLAHQGNASGKNLGQGQSSGINTHYSKFGNNRFQMR